VEGQKIEEVKLVEVQKRGVARKYIVKILYR